ncbi:MAG: hypothetical protein K9L30_08785 [Desulfobacterales bacterium]|nr:hypothetical protein [Desulfobacterales bacterium]
MVDKDSAIAEIQRLKDEIKSVESRVKLYLHDRKNNPHPEHEEFVTRVRIRESVLRKTNNRDVIFWLDNLMHSLSVYDHYWRKDFEDDAEQMRNRIREKTNSEVIDLTRIVR